MLTIMTSNIFAIGSLKARAELKQARALKLAHMINKPEPELHIQSSIRLVKFNEAIIFIIISIYTFFKIIIHVYTHILG